MKSSINFAAAICLLAGIQLLPSNANAISSTSTSGTATATVQSSITLAANTSLAFGSAAPGDAAKTVIAGQGASFAVGGAPGVAYTVTLPGDNVVVMTTSGGTGADYEIAVNGFTKSNNAALSVGGADTLSVGATRAALTTSQATGSYSGTFTVMVAY